MTLDPHSGRVSNILGRRWSESFKGVNDLVFAQNGDIYFTDQGQTGMHDPTGRVYRLRTDGTLDLLVGNVPSRTGWCSMARSTFCLSLPPVATVSGASPDAGRNGIRRSAIFVQLSGGLAGPDGLAMDSEDNLIVAHAAHREPCGYSAVSVNRSIAFARAKGC